MSSAPLPCVELEPQRTATHSVVWLHGLGADGHDFEPIVPLLGLEGRPVRWIFPHAPARPITINGGMVMPAWYDILGLDFDGRREDELGVLHSSAQVAALLARERARGVPSARTVLAGFSQGGAIALHLGLREAEPLAGILALSTYLVRRDRLAAEFVAGNRGVPILQCHGTFDPMVPMDRGAAARDELQALGLEVDWRTYPMQHQVCDEELRDIGVWLRRVLE
jgi:phospholipase/carboxylesterase